MPSRLVRRIDSKDNAVFKRLKKVLSGRGVRRYESALISGSKSVSDAIAAFPDRCESWICRADQGSTPSGLPADAETLVLSGPLFRALDIFGTDAPLLLLRTPPIPEWRPDQGLARGCTLLVPFQDPENVGAVIRSAVAFGVANVVLLSGCAHPFHPKAIRASGGAVLHAACFTGPPLDELPDDLPIVALSAEGSDIGAYEFPARFALLPGIEGPGLPSRFRASALSIPMTGMVESLNAAAAAAIALYLWNRSASPVRR